MVIDRVLLHEGGVADVGDGKGITKWGQTPDWLRTFGLTPPETEDAARLNYANWMQQTGLDFVADTDTTLGAALVDWAVHSGHMIPIRALQRSLNVPQDGVIGPQTRHALLALGKWRRLVLLLHTERIIFIGRIITDAPEKHARYAAGWMSRMAANLRADLG